MRHAVAPANFFGSGGSRTLSIDAIRTLAIDAVQHAHSGHAGTPMGMAPVVYTLWQHFLRYDPAHPGWPNRDRFVLSAGHASLLLYAILHLAKVTSADDSESAAVTIEDIKRFRQLGSRTPGHPQFSVVPGAETTTGPLGQGCGNSVGMAVAARWLAGRYNRPGFTIFDYDVYVLCSDGDLMEGVASEAASLAAHLGLSNLCWIYDRNRITIEGKAEAYRAVLQLKDRPACLVLSRQALPIFGRHRHAAAAGLRRGGYIFADAENCAPELILIGSGSELQLCVEVYERLKTEGIPARVVSLPSWELFELQDESYRTNVLPPDVTTRVDVEQGSALAFERYVGQNGAVIAMRSFGASAPWPDLLAKFGFTSENVHAAAKTQLARRHRQ
ncbi:MAG: hypothetical protein K2Y27_12850 [Xanthobacteraceae bacterium]|nr:hypothetical protein [Xanthobacteraceae bacterium]